jgi:sec-independent protein translocase protein TatA
MFSLGPMELILILIIALVIFGPRKLPEVGKAMGKAINEFKSASRNIQKEINDAAKEPDNS